MLYPAREIDFMLPTGFYVGDVMMFDYPVGLSQEAYWALDFAAMFTITDHRGFQTPVFALHLPVEPIRGLAVQIGRHRYVIEHVIWDDYNGIFEIGLATGHAPGIVLQDIHYGLDAGIVEYPGDLSGWDLSGYSYAVGDTYGGGYSQFGVVEFGAPGVTFVGGLTFGEALAFEVAEGIEEAIVENRIEEATYDAGFQAGEQAAQYDENDDQPDSDEESDDEEDEEDEEDYDDSAGDNYYGNDE